MRALLDSLFAAYGPQHWWPAQSVEEMMVGAILVQNSSWTQVERVIAQLQLHDLLSLAALRQMPAEQLWPVLRPVGFFRLKTRRLKALADFMAQYDDRPEQLFQQETQRLRQSLLQVNGIGKETADAILCYGARRPLFVVDAYTKRLFYRLGRVAENASYDTIQAMVHQGLPNSAEQLGELHALIVCHGKEHCRARPRCALCPLHFCPAFGRLSP
ncbi:MAG: hypothetical protein HQL80_11195 [Magnetococcales bacterium]|nr:hypothetical protein [Magnetococcales bacterium]MBF0584781.1 hypothetical protein [Magnetococcales bacterium]